MILEIWVSGVYLQSIIMFLMLNCLYVFHISLLKWNNQKVITQRSPGCVGQSVTCLATDMSLTADPEVTSSIPAPYFRGG